MSMTSPQRIEVEIPANEKKNDPRTERLVTVSTAQDQHNLHAPPPPQPCHDVTNGVVDLHLQECLSGLCSVINWQSWESTLVIL